MRESDPPSYRLSPSGELRAPVESRLREAAVWTVVVVLLLACALAGVLAITHVTGVWGLLAGAALALLPVCPVVATILWFDRYEAEPPALLGFAFAWGASVAALGALVVNTASVTAIQASGGDPSTEAVLVAPVVEETLKGLAVVMVVLLRRMEFDGVVDGIVYAGMAGVGFAFVENILYLGSEFGDAGSGSAVLVFILRCVVSPFAHPLFTAAFGVGLGMVVRSRSRLVQVLAPPVGFAVAVVLHGAWNLSASGGLRGFVGLYAGVQVPIFVAFVLMALYARRREGALIGRNLAEYRAAGWLSSDEAAMIASIPQRKLAVQWAFRTSGQAGAEAMKAFQHLATELAFLRERMKVGRPPREAEARELAMLEGLALLRRRFMNDAGR